MSVKKYSKNEELANTITHGIGVLCGTAASIWLLNTAIRHNSWAFYTTLVYAVCMVLSYITSTIYHATVNPEKKALLRKFDHAVIYLHIAGTYTFFTLVVLRNYGYWGWTLFAIAWLAAISGCILSFSGKKTGSKLETICYVAMGSVILVALSPLLNALNAIGSLKTLWYIIAGGLSFTIGALFYSFKKVKYMHSVFHLFVLGGSIFHILAIAETLNYVDK